MDSKLTTKRPLALFDFDHTLITTNSLGHLFCYLDKAPPYRRVLAEASSWLRLSDLTSYVAIKTAIKTHLYRSVLKGHPATALADAALYAADKLTVNKAAAKVYSEAARSGHTMVIVTASPTAYIEPLLPRLGITADHVVGTDLETTVDGKLTGQFDGPECIRTAKPGKVQAFLASTFPTAPAKLALAVGNPPDDDALLAMGQRAIAVDKISGKLTILRP